MLRQFTVCFLSIQHLANYLDDISQAGCCSRTTIASKLQCEWGRQFQTLYIPTCTSILSSYIDSLLIVAINVVKLQSCDSFTYIYREKALCNFALDIKISAAVCLTLATVNSSSIIIYKSLLINFSIVIYAILLINQD